MDKRFERLEKQSAEFDALTKLSEIWRKLQQVAVVDDDYPEYRHHYESALKDFIDALTANRRFEKLPVPIDMFKMHEQMTGKLFPAYSSTDERFLALALCGETGELANMIKKRWRDGVDLSEQIKDELADIRVYLELLAKCFGIEGAKLDDQVFRKLRKVVEKHGLRV